MFKLDGVVGRSWGSLYVSIKERRDADALGIFCAVSDAFENSWIHFHCERWRTQTRMVLKVDPHARVPIHGHGIRK